MYCQSCGTKNPEDANFCKTCGTRIAQPGTKGGLIVDDTDAGLDTRPAGSVDGKGEDTIRDDRPPAGVIEGRAAPVKDDVETTLAGLRSRSTNSLTSMSLSLATISVRSPARSYLIVLAIILGLVAVGAGTSYAVMLVYAQNEAVIVTTTSPPPGELPPVEVGFPEVESPESLADLSSGAVEGRPSRGGSGSEGSTGQGDPPNETSPSGETGGQSSGSPPPRSSSTTVEAPPDPPPSSSGEGAAQPPPSSSGGAQEGGGAPSGGEPSSPSGGGSSTTPETPERDIEMEMYAAQVRSVIQRFYAARAQSCFDRATRNNHQLRGTVVIQFTIGTGGNVSAASPLRNTTGDQELGSCIAGQVRSWRLPEPPRGQPVEMQMPFSW